MKITKSALIKLIKEELKNLQEDWQTERPYPVADEKHPERESGGGGRHIKTVLYNLKNGKSITPELLGEFEREVNMLSMKYPDEFPTGDYMPGI